MLVQVALEADEVHLDTPLGAVAYRGAAADVQHAGVAFPLHIRVNGIDSFFRYQLVGAGRLEVGGREAQFAPHLIAAYYLPVQVITIAQIAVSTRHIAFFQ
ncbi:unknown [Bacteroides sp. CAG:702]|nr:unknown [Bacteroides sp. CAG:702]